MIMKAENIDINGKKNEENSKIKNFWKIEKDCIKRKWRQDWDMNDTL